MDNHRLSHEIDSKKCCQIYRTIGLRKGRGWFSNFLGAPIIIYKAKSIFIAANASLRGPNNVSPIEEGRAASKSLH